MPRQQRHRSPQRSARHAQTAGILSDGGRGQAKLLLQPCFEGRAQDLFLAAEALGVHPSPGDNHQIAPSAQLLAVRLHCRVHETCERRHLRELRGDTVQVEDEAPGLHALRPCDAPLNLTEPTVKAVVLEKASVSSGRGTALGSAERSSAMMIWLADAEDVSFSSASGGISTSCSFRKDA
mmetsp:Transcript_80508/g.211381  ORF Transcript_80508/g.211381 Transcript_80508/m.211381 type:complete len:180 (-) Transcript_80508:111-650(-)